MEHNIEITLANGKVAPVEVPQGVVLREGDTVRYTSPQGKTRVVFDLPSNGAFDQILDGQALTLKRTGRFFFKCFITPFDPPAAKEEGWSDESPEAGGEHDVKPRLGP